MFRITDYVRWFFVVLLLAFVWMGNKYAVALGLSFIFLGDELYYIASMIKHTRELKKFFQATLGELKNPDEPR